MKILKTFRFRKKELTIDGEIARINREVNRLVQEKARLEKVNEEGERLDREQPMREGSVSTGGYVRGATGQIPRSGVDRLEVEISGLKDKLLILQGKTRHEEEKVGQR